MQYSVMVSRSGARLYYTPSTTSQNWVWQRNKLSKTVFRFGIDFAVFVTRGKQGGHQLTQFEEEWSSGSERVWDAEPQMQD